MTSTRTPSSIDPNGRVACPTCIGSIISCSAAGNSLSATWSDWTTSPLNSAASFSAPPQPPMLLADSAKRDNHRVGIGRRGPGGNLDRHLLEAEHCGPRSAVRTLRRSSMGNDRVAARDFDRPRQGVGRHPTNDGADRVGQLLGMDPAKVAADRRRRCFAILARISSERRTLLQRGDDLVGVGEHFGAIGRIWPRERFRRCEIRRCPWRPRACRSPP